MTLLETHLEQMFLSAKTIADLQFQPPKIFTNALLGDHEITTLIRDTEPHERALFSADANAANSTSSRQAACRGSTFLVDENGAYGRNIYDRAHPRKHSVVANILGGDMLHRIQRSSGNATRQKNGAPGGIDIEVLLQGAEKLCNVYSMDGAVEKKIANLRNRHSQIIGSIAMYEEKVAKQTSKLERMNNGSGYGSDDDHDETQDVMDSRVPQNTNVEEALRLEEQEVRELEVKRHALEERVAGMEKDLSGLM